MKLKTRLIVAFFTIVLLPIFMAVIALFGLGSYQIKSLERAYGIDEYTYESLSNPTPLLSKLTDVIYEEIKNHAAGDTSVFDDQQYLGKLNSDLNDRSSYLVVRKADDIVFAGDEKEIEQLTQQLPDFQYYDLGSENAVYLGNELKVLVKQSDFLFQDGAEGTAFIVTDLDSLVPQVKSLYSDMVIAIIAILAVTGIFLTAWIYRGIMIPLQKLKLAAQNIKDGNLDFHLEIKECKNEIDELCVDFEEMRKRLKISAEEKVNQDSDNKELITNISHDLKTPITAVKGYVEGIMDGVADTPEKMDKYIRTIYNKANEMDTLINELTFYSQIDTNRIPYTFNKMHVTDFFSDCVEELKLDLEAKNMKFSYTNYVDDSVEIIADAEQIKRVIHNIINNSVKYMDKEQGFIHMKVDDIGDDIQVEIEDNGKGISAKDLPYIFDRFYRTDTSRNSAQGGSGIGLSIVRKIIEEHGGKIWATSKESVGTTMYFVLRKYEEVVIDE